MLDLLRKRRRTLAAYRAVFMESGRLTKNAETVLSDLFGFVRLFKKITPDPMALALAEGGREVLRHVLENLKTTDDEIARQMRRETEGDDYER